MRYCLLLCVCLGCICLSCNKRPANEHYYLSFKNTSSDTVYITNHYWLYDNDRPVPGFSRVHPFRLGPDDHAVPPGATKKEVDRLQYWLTYEYIFTKTDVFKVYVLPVYVAPGEDDGTWIPLVRYDLSLDDMVSLNYYLSYPPDERMKGVKMDPSYESFANR